MNGDMDLRKRRYTRVSGRAANPWRWAMAHIEEHRSQVGGWLRAAVLGANDGIVSIASLVLGVAAAEAGAGVVATAGVAGLVGGGAVDGRR